MNSEYLRMNNIENKLKLSIIVIQSNMIKLKIDKEKLVDILKNFLCVFDKNYNKNAIISYKDNMDVFILAKVMEMNEKEINNFVFEILYAIREYLYNVCKFYVNIIQFKCNYNSQRLFVVFFILHNVRRKELLWHFLIFG